jgi:hypothetical protein
VGSKARHSLCILTNRSESPAQRIRGPAKMRIVLAWVPGLPTWNPALPIPWGKRALPPMRSLLAQFWRDERGSLLVMEWVFVATILVLSIVPAAWSVRQRIRHAPVEMGRPHQIDAATFFDTKPAN